MRPAPTVRRHEFMVKGSPVSVNRYGHSQYRNWRSTVYSASIPTPPTWSGSLFAGECSVRIRYFRVRDRIKDVDNILKAILDALDGKISGSIRHADSVITDDRRVELVMSQRTNLGLGARIDGRRLRRQEYAALLHARRGQAAVYVGVHNAPDHGVSISR